MRGGPNIHAAPPRPKEAGCLPADRLPVAGRPHVTLLPINMHGTNAVSAMSGILCYGLVALSGHAGSAASAAPSALVPNPNQVTTARNVYCRVAAHLVTNFPTWSLHLGGENTQLVTASAAHCGSTFCLDPLLAGQPASVRRDARATNTLPEANHDPGDSVRGYTRATVALLASSAGPLWLSIYDL